MASSSLEPSKRGDQSKPPTVDGVAWLLGGSGNPVQRKTGWASMNWIQRAGGLSFIILFIPAVIASGGWHLFFALCSWTCLFLGYVAGSLWKLRHALHFWWSLIAATLAHACLIPLYLSLIRLNDSIHHAQGPRGVIYLTGLLLSAEVLIFLFILKRFGLWLHNRTHSVSH